MIRALAIPTSYPTELSAGGTSGQAQTVKLTLGLVSASLSGILPVALIGALASGVVYSEKKGK